MLKFDFANCMADKVGAEHGATPDELSNIAQRVVLAHNQLQKWRTSKDAIFYDYPFEAGLAERVRKHGEEVRTSFENFILLGIGGSALGFRLISSALLQPHFNFLDRKARGNAPRLFIVDNIDPDSFSTLIEHVDLKETCFNVVSKSGTTLETMAQLFIVLPILKERLGGKWRKHVYITTDPQSGPLRKFAAAENLKSFEIPPKLGGRYSALSAVGLFPAACVGIDVEGLIDGARAFAKLSGGTDLQFNNAYRNAVMHEILGAKGKTVSIMMPYSERLTGFADWYVQLFAESLGKGGMGETPMKAVGTTDQHSVLQLFMDGPNDKIISFVGVDEFHKSAVITQAAETFEYIKGRDMAELMKASLMATAEALAMAKRPSLTIKLPKITPQAIGSLIMFYEISIAFLGALRALNPFDQPAVELGKKLTKKILQEA